MKMSSGLKREQGFTLIEVMIVVAVIAILAAIAIPNFIRYRQKSYDAAAQADTKNAYTVAQAYFADYPDYTGDITYNVLTTAGLRMTSAVTFSHISGSKSSLSMSFYHLNGTKIYSVDAEGVLSSALR